MPKGTDVVVIGAEEIATEVLAESIVKLSDAFARVQASGLNRRALLVLLKDASGVPMDQIGRVLNAIPQLKAIYTVPQAQKKR